MKKLLLLCLFAAIAHAQTWPWTPPPLLGVYLFSQLPVGGLILGTPANTTDRGLVYWNGTAWTSTPVDGAAGVIASGTVLCNSTGGAAAPSACASINLTGNIFNTASVNFTGTYSTPSATVNPYGWVGTVTGSSSTSPFNIIDFKITSDNFADTYANATVTGLNVTHNFGGALAKGGYIAINGVVQNDNGTSGQSSSSYVGFAGGGTLDYNDNGGALTFTGGPSGTSATLNANWPNVTGIYRVQFSDGEVRQVTLTNGATTATWSGALTGSPTTAAGAYAGTIYAMNPSVNLHCNSGVPGTPPCATYTNGLNGGEIDLNALTNTNPWSIIGLQIINQATSGVVAVGENIGYSVQGPSANGNWQMAYGLGSYDGNPGMASTGTVFGCWEHASTFQQTGLGGNCASTGYGVDFAGLGNGGYPVVFSQAAFASQGFKVDGSGHILNSTAGGTINIGNDTAGVYNGITVIPGVTGTGVQIQGAGVDATQNLYILSAGTAGHIFFGSGGTTNVGAEISGPNASGDYVTLNSIASGNSFAEISTAGADANIGMWLNTKGTGQVFVAPGTDGSAFAVKNAARSNTYFSVNTSTNAIALGIASTAVTMPGLASSSAPTTGTVCWTTVTGNLTVNPGGNCGGVAPTISSGFGTGASVTHSSGTSSFSVNVGTGGVASSGVISMPAATNGWACSVSEVTTPATDNTFQTGSSTATVTVTNYARTTGIAAAWTASDILQMSCWAN